MKKNVFKEANKIWKQVSAATEQRAGFGLDIYRRRLNFFMSCNYYYYVFNLHEAVFEMMSAEMPAVLGYRIETNGRSQFSGQDPFRRPAMVFEF